MKAKNQRNLPVSIADIASYKQDDHTIAQIILFHEPSHRAFSIYTGYTEAIAIAMGMREEITTIRPTSQDFAANLLKASGVKVNKVIISEIIADVFYATVNIKSGMTLREVDARPSDAIALAVQMKAPLFASEAILDAISIQVPAGKQPTERGINKLLQPYVQTPDTEYITDTDDDVPKTTEDIILEAFV